MRALVNRPSAALADCELTFLERRAIDVGRAQRQHAAYAEALRASGVHVDTLQVNTRCPDGVFIEDVAVILDEIAVVTSLGSPSRRAETFAIGQAIAEYRETVAMSSSGDAGGRRCPASGAHLVRGAVGSYEQGGRRGVSGDRPAVGVLRRPRSTSMAVSISRPASPPSTTRRVWSIGSGSM